MDLLCACGCHQHTATSDFQIRTHTPRGVTLIPLAFSINREEKNPFGIGPRSIRRHADRHCCPFFFQKYLDSFLTTRLILGLTLPLSSSCSDRCSCYNHSAISQHPYCQHGDCHPLPYGASAHGLLILDHFQACIWNVGFVRFANSLGIRLPQHRRESEPPNWRQSGIRLEGGSPSCCCC